MSAPERAGPPAGTRAPDVLCWGDVGLDVYEDEAAPRPGGCALNVAMALVGSVPSASSVPPRPPSPPVPAARRAAPGGAVRVACAGPIGADGEHLRDVLRRGGVDATLVEVQPGATPRQRIRLGADGERALCGHAAGVLGTYRPGERMLAAVRSAGLVYVPLFAATRPLAERAWAERAGDRGVAVDLMDLDGAEDELVVEAVRRSTVVFAGLHPERQRERIARLEALAGAAGAALVVVTLGAAGAAAFSRGRALRIAALPIPGGRVVDTTGCGDAFAGAFLATWRRGADLGAALRAGGRLAAGVAARRGAVKA